MFNVSCVILVQSSSRASSRCSSRTSSIADSEFSEASDTMNAATSNDVFTYPRSARQPWTLEQVPRRKLPTRPSKTASNFSRTPRAVTPTAVTDSKRRASTAKETTRSAECLNVMPGQAVSFPVDGTPAAGASSKLPRTLMYAAPDNGEAVFKTPRPVAAGLSRVADAGSRIPRSQLPVSPANPGESATDERRVKHAVSTGSLDCVSTGSSSSKVMSRIPTRTVSRKQSDA